jgi:hypothetical protein
MEGKGTVRRLPSKPPAGDTPVIRRIAPRNFSVMFMMFFNAETLDEQRRYNLLTPHLRVLQDPDWDGEHEATYNQTVQHHHHASPASRDSPRNQRKYRQP